MAFYLQSTGNRYVFRKAIIQCQIQATLRRVTISAIGEGIDSTTQSVTYLGNAFDDAKNMRCVPPLAFS
jgi:hypothetical protein